MWDPVDPSTANGNFTGYKITYWAQESDDDAEEEEEEGDEETKAADERWRRAAPRILGRSKRDVRSNSSEPPNLHYFRRMMARREHCISVPTPSRRF